MALESFPRCPDILPEVLQRSLPSSCRIQPRYCWTLFQSPQVSVCCYPENMEYKRLQSSPQIKPRLIIHGGAGNIKPTNLTPERYEAVRRSLLGMVCTSYNSIQAMVHAVASD